jgi:hypothetical protein
MIIKYRSSINKHRSARQKVLPATGTMQHQTSIVSSSSLWMTAGGSTTAGQPADGATATEGGG